MCQDTDSWSQKCRSQSKEYLSLAIQDEFMAQNILSSREALQIVNFAFNNSDWEIIVKVKEDKRTHLYKVIIPCSTFYSIEYYGLGYEE